MTPVTLTGCPDNLVGENLAPRAAAAATARNSGWPDTAAAEITLPFSSIVTCTTTVPAAWACRAIGGYAGLGRLIALPLSTPPEIGALGGVGVAFGGGGGGSSAMFTLVGPATSPVPVPGPDAMGAAALESLDPTTVVTPRLTGGMLLALAETSFGTSSVLSTLAINSLRTSTFCSCFCGFTSSCFFGSFCCCGTGTGATSVVSSRSWLSRVATVNHILP